MNKIIVALQPMNLGKVIFLAYSDSSVDYRDRTTMAETFTDHDLSRVWHLSQIGFSYTEDEPCKLPAQNFRPLNTDFRRSSSCLVTKLLLRCANSKRRQG